MRSPSKRLLSSDSNHQSLDKSLREEPLSIVDNGSGGSPPPKHTDKRPLVSAEGIGLSMSPLQIMSQPRHIRADTLPEKSADAPAFITSQQVVKILKEHAEEVLILDLRVSTQYAKACIKSAMNLCVPTTLLKRPSYDTGRLAETFKDVAQQERFLKWETCKYIIVYDASTAQMKDRDIANCLNILKKFTNEGWSGEPSIIRGGFMDFSRNFPDWLQQNDEAPGSHGMAKPALSLQSGDNKVAPVIGGCPMPATKSAANPFFGNIRQNMDLIGGVGQMEVRYPSNMTAQQKHDVPSWLIGAAQETNHGKDVADKFLQIEKREQKRMQEALSGNVQYGTPTPGAARKVQIAGIEKGSKNRYNNIWPYEHSRVKLQGVPRGDCDYINASNVATSRSKKTYIATQGPIPSTFGDFWNMVWQRQVRVIVMLTAESEGGQIKAHNYWREGIYGNYKLQFHSEHRASLEMKRITNHRKRPSAGGRRHSSTPKTGMSRRASKDETDGTTHSEHNDGAAACTEESPYVIVRRFTLANDSQPFERLREITQLQYSSWPDFGAPAHPAHLLGLVEQCDAVVQASKQHHSTSSPLSPRVGPDEAEEPVLVHCSAGCGRTGTFCTVDSVVDMLKAQRKSKQQQRPRDASPMDLDPPGWEGKTIKDDNPFFGGFLAVPANPSTPGDAKDWLMRDDVDLIEKTVEELRLQRLSMVQSLRQYVLCYETVLEWFAHQD